MNAHVLITSLRTQADLTPVVLCFFVFLDAWRLLLLQGYSLNYRNEEGKRGEVVQHSHTNASLARAVSPLGLRKSRMTIKRGKGRRFEMGV